MKSVLCVVLAANALVACSRGPDAEFQKAVPWALAGGVRVVLDSHTHTRFSDGSLQPPALAAKAVENGCTALAITDHGDLSERAATPEYFAEIDSVRARYPDMTVFAGLEWNIPPYDGREHVTVLVDPALERRVLPEFKARFEAKSAQVEEALRWLVQQVSDPAHAALIYNHPSRRDTDPDENYRDYVQWQEEQGLFVGLEGGPGHQKADHPGDYRGRFTTRNRWDPAVADIGGTWDRLLDAGHSVWGAIAVSDYHGAMDYAPCEFARTHLRAPKRDAQGILQALRAGSFWAGHGRVLDDLVFIAVHPALPLPATAGETVRLRASATPPVFRVSFVRGVGGTGIPIDVEVIGNGISGKPEKVSGGTVSIDRNAFDWSPGKLAPGGDGRSAYFRARVIARLPSGEALVAYTNPIRFTF